MNLAMKMTGPCKGCGATNFGLSTRGPDFCGACACGVPPEVSKLRRELDDLHWKYIDALFALQIVTGHKLAGLNKTMVKRGDDFLTKFKQG